MPLPLPTRTNGQVIDQTWFNDINTELVSLETKHNLLVDDSAIIFNLRGLLNNLRSRDGVAFMVVTQPLTLLSAKTFIETNGSSYGSLDIDLKFKRGAGAWTSIFQTRPAIPYSAGNEANSTDDGTPAVIDSTYDELIAGDFLRLDVINVPDGDPENCYLQLNREITGT